MQISLNRFLAPILLLTFLATACGGTEAGDADVEATSVDAVTGYMDPVCQMKVSPDASIRHTHEGVTYGFCSETCKEAFVAAPASYLAALEE